MQKEATEKRVQFSIQPYLDHFGFDKLPFAIQPDPQFYCAFPHHEEALFTVEQALANNEVITKITGDVGTGKTMVFEMCKQHLGDDYQVLTIANPYMRNSDFVHALIRQLPVEGEVDDNMDLLSKFRWHLEHYIRQGKPALVLIDEAQAMSDDLLETIRLFTNLSYEGKPLTTVVLIGQTELDHKLAQPELRQIAQRINFSHEMRCLTLHETVEYVQTRVRIASAQKFRSAIEFDHDALVRIHKLSQGIPRMVNIVTHRSLLAAYSGYANSVTLAHVVYANQGNHWLHRVRDFFSLKNASILWLTVVTITNMSLFGLLLTKQ